ncbi:hypothetical protein DIM_10790 [Candidatus Denitrolinea symbiosum]|nr:hypothetical protein DIM_10790 [Candidatus Denitrolinea symbiosum]
MAARDRDISLSTRGKDILIDKRGTGNDRPLKRMETSCLQAAFPGVKSGYERRLYLGDFAQSRVR